MFCRVLFFVSMLWIQTLRQACSHHEVIPSATGQAVANLQNSEDTPPDWYDPDIEGLIEEIPQISEEVFEVLMELE